jgi:hypothetical protein
LNSSENPKGPASGPFVVGQCEAGQRTDPTLQIAPLHYFSPFGLALSSVPDVPLSDGVRVMFFLEPDFVAEPVVVPDFILLDFIFVPVAPGAAVPSLDAPGAGWVCAEAMAVVPNIAAMTTAESASFDRMRILPGETMRKKLAKWI